MRPRRMHPPQLPEGLGRDLVVSDEPRTSRRRTGTNSINPSVSVTVSAPARLIERDLEVRRVSCHHRAQVMPGGNHYAKRHRWTGAATTRREPAPVGFVETTISDAARFA